MSVPNARQKNTIYVAGLDMNVTREVLMDAFIPFGDIIGISLPGDEKSNDPHRGFATIEHETVLDANAAIDNMDQAQLYGRTLRVTVSKIQNETFDIFTSKAAVWEQEGWLQQHVVNEADREAVAQHSTESQQADAMQGLEENIARPAH